ncbi:hypothetical protein DRN43_06270 [Thermococci archaeon]|nr:MAG: hypothetical protein DRN43_06270 [Thermococci archaeon]
MGKVSKVATKNSGSHSGVSGKKKRKTRLHISIDEDVGEVLDKLYINKSRFINDLLRMVLFE